MQVQELKRLWGQAAGGYKVAAAAFHSELAAVERGKTPLPETTELRKLVGRLFVQLGLYDEAERMLLWALSMDRQIQGAEAPEVAKTLHLLAEMLRGYVSACQVSALLSSPPSADAQQQQRAEEREERERSATQPPPAPPLRTRQWLSSAWAPSWEG